MRFANLDYQTYDKTVPKYKIQYTGGSYLNSLWPSIQSYANRPPLYDFSCKCSLCSNARLNPTCNCSCQEIKQEPIRQHVAQAKKLLTQNVDLPEQEAQPITSHQQIEILFETDAIDELDQVELDAEYKQWKLINDTNKRLAKDCSLQINKFLRQHEQGNTLDQN